MNPTIQTLKQQFKSFIPQDSSTRKKYASTLFYVIGLPVQFGGESGTPKPKPRPLTENDVEGWYEAAAHRKPPRSADQIRAALRSRNSYRWKRMMKEYEFFRKQMAGMGLNPEDLRWLL